MARSKYMGHEEDMDFKVELYKKQGLSDIQISHNLGISKTTFYKYLKRYPSFLAAYKRGRVEIIEQLENAMYKAALGGFVEEVVTEIKVDNKGEVKSKYIKKTKKYLAVNVVANIFLTTNLNGAKYKRNPDLNPMVDDSQVIELEFVNEEKRNED